jgi:hypothetical protein
VPPDQWRLSLSRSWAIELTLPFIDGRSPFLPKLIHARGREARDRQFLRANSDAQRSKNIDLALTKPIGYTFGISDLPASRKVPRRDPKSKSQVR